MFYPQQSWFPAVKTEDVDEIVVRLETLLDN